MEESSGYNYGNTEPNMPFVPDPTYTAGQLHPAEPAPPLAPFSITVVSSDGVFTVTFDLTNEWPFHPDTGFDKAPSENWCRVPGWAERFCAFWTEKMGLDKEDCAVITTGCDAEVVSGKKFNTEEVILGVPATFAAGTQQAGLAAVNKLQTVVNRGVTGLRTITVQAGTGPAAPATPSATVGGNTPTAPAIQPSAGTFTRTVILVIAGFTTSNFDANAQSDLRSVVAQAGGIAPGNVRVTNVAQVSSSAGTALQVTLEISGASQEAVDAAIQRLRDTIRNQNQRLGSFTILSISTNGNSPASAAWIRPAMLWALAALLPALLF